MVHRFQLLEITDCAAPFQYWKLRLGFRKKMHSFLKAHSKSENKPAVDLTDLAG